MPSNNAVRRLFVTTALPYANGKLHLGHLLEYIQADVWVRAQRMAGNSVQFVCADDAHGAPIMIAAERAGLTSEEFVAEISSGRNQYLAGFNIRFDNWHSTHSEENLELAQAIYRRLKANDMIVKRPVEQFYDPVKQMFLPDRYIKGCCPKCRANDQYGDSCEACGAVYAPTDLLNPFSTLTGATPELRSSQHLFFKLSDPAVLEFLKAWTTKGTLQPEMAKKTGEWFDAGLVDWDISRDAPYFGIPIPEEDDKFFYVWLDAPVGYLASLKNHFDKGQAAGHWHAASRVADNFEQFLADPRVEQVHFIGKDIVYFHALFWPAMLHFSGGKPPTQVFVHGHLTVNGEKMSKSRGNGIDPLRYLELGMDPEWLRYYMAAKLNGGIEDTDFKTADFVSRVNADLIGKFVNIASRASGFITKKFAGVLGDMEEDGRSLVCALQEFVVVAAKLYEAREYSKCVRETMLMADAVNAFFDRKKPWDLSKREGLESSLWAVCTACIEAFRLLSICLKPIAPGLAGRVEAFLQIEPLDFGSATSLLGGGHSICEYKHLMGRVDLKIIEQAFEGRQEIF